jgi:Arc/MetJ-type ribon-helix-helix transcriptional regulator
VLLTSILLAAQLQFALPPEKETWVRVESPHFTVISAARERDTRELVTRMETLALVLQNLHARFREQPMVHSRVLLFDERAEAQPYFDLIFSRGTRAPGAFISGKDGGTMVLSTRIGARTPYHELVHNLMGGATRPPLWLEEGLAEYYSNADFVHDTIRLGLPRRNYDKPMRGFRPMNELFAVRREQDMTADNGFYRQASGAVAWLLRTDRAAFDGFESDVEHGMPVDAALRKHYHATVAQVEKGLMGMYRSQKYVVVAPAVNMLITAQTMRYADVLYELGTFLAQFRPEDAERYFRAALAADPNHAKARAVLEPKHDPTPDLRQTAQALVDEGKYDDAAVIVRKLAALSADPATKNDLEAQAAHLERTAATNRHIAEYEKAIEEAKAGDKAAALKRLEALLAVATDEEVIHDAKELQAELLRK